MAPIYNPDNSYQIEEESIQFVISDSMFLEMLLLHIRGKTIRFSSNLARIQRQEEAKLILEIDNLENQEREIEIVESKKKGVRKT